MKGITFLGAAGTVTGSSFLLSDGVGQNLLIDLGMFQGVQKIADLNNIPLAFDGTLLSGVIVTHAHLDHCGRLPLLLRTGFTGKVYMTNATRMLAEITLFDAAKLAKERTEDRLLFTEKDVETILRAVEIVPYDKEFSVGSFGITLRDAGHILGSASVEVWCDDGLDGKEKIVFSGDLGNSPEALVRPTTMIDWADVVVMESTYGDRLHSTENPSDVIAEEINVIEESGGVLLLPAFSIERSQELIHLIDHLKKDKKISETIRVYLDSPMAIKATKVYKQCKDLYSSELKTHALVDDPFDFPGLFFLEDAKESRAIHNLSGPKVIIAGSGMMTGGRILHHLKTYGSLDTTRILFLGYQGEETLGRYILEGSREVRVDGERILIRAHVRKMSAMSAHADQAKLFHWIQTIKETKKIFLVHGEQQPREVFAEKLKKELSVVDIVLPQLGETYSI